MKFFVDTADLKEIREAAAMGLDREGPGLATCPLSADWNKVPA